MRGVWGTTKARTSRKVVNAVARKLIGRFASEPHARTTRSYKAHSSSSHMTDKSDTLPAARLQELARTIDPKLNLEPDAEKVVQDVLDDFVENLASFACELAVHRSSTTLEARDIQLALGAFIFMTRTLSRALCAQTSVRSLKLCVSLSRAQRRTGTCGSLAWPITSRI